MLKVKKVHHFTGHSNSIYALGCSYDEDHVISAGGDGVIAEWDLVNGGDGKQLARVPTQVFSVMLLPELNYLLAGQLKGGIHILDLNENKEIRFLTLHDSSIFDLKYDAIYNRVLAASGDGHLSVWSVPDFELLMNVELSKQNLRQITFQQNGDDLAVGCSADHVHILDRHSLKVKYQYKAHENSVFSLAYFKNDRFLITGSRDAYLKVWDVDQLYAPYHSIPAHMLTINEIALSPNGKLLASAGRDNEIRLWDTDTFELLKVINQEKLEGHQHSVNRLLWNAKYNYLISASDDRSVMVWDVD